jgi:hypothetical protein
MRQPAVRAGQVTIPNRRCVHRERRRRSDAHTLRRLAGRARARAVVALLIAGATSSACYSYVPVSLGAVESKEDVRVRVTEDAAARLAKELGTFSTQIDGQLGREGADSISVGVEIDRAYRGTTIGTTTQVLFLGRSEVVEVRKREFSRSRTILVATGTAVGFGLLAAGIAQLVDPNGPSQDQPPPPPPAPLRRPSALHFAVRIPIP